METIDDESLAARRLSRPGQGGAAVLHVVERHPHAFPHSRQARDRRARAAMGITMAWSSTTCTSASCYKLRRSGWPTTPSSSIRPTTVRTTTPGRMPAPRLSAARRTRTGKARSACPRPSSGPAFPCRHHAQRHRLARGLATDLRGGGRRAGHQGPAAQGGVQLGRRPTKTTSMATTSADYLSGKCRSHHARNSFMWATTASCRSAWVDMEERLPWRTGRTTARVWREPMIQLRLPLLFNLRRDPFEDPSTIQQTYHDWRSTGRSC